MNRIPRGFRISGRGWVHCLLQPGLVPIGRPAPIPMRGKARCKRLRPSLWAVGLLDARTTQEGGAEGGTLDVALELACLGK